MTGPVTAQSLKDKLAARRAGTQDKLVQPAAIAAIQKVEAAAPQVESPISSLTTPFDVIQGFDATGFLNTLETFKTQLALKAPGIPTYLREIHKNLYQYQELAYLLNDEQLNLVCSGFFHITDTKMAEVVVKSRSKKAQVSVDEAEKLFG